MPASRIAVTAGASGAFTLAFLACFEPGDRVAVPTPGYPCYRNVLRALEVEVVDIPVGPETRFQPSPSDLKAVGQLQGLVVASPSNPTGTMLLEEELLSLISWCRSEGVRLISDEIYHGITYGDPAPTAASHWEEAVVVNSFSKYFSMYNSSLLKNFNASDFAVKNKFSNLLSSSTIFIPFPPPPPAALIKTG